MSLWRRSCPSWPASSGLLRGFLALDFVGLLTERSSRLLRKVGNRSFLLGRSHRLLDVLPGRRTLLLARHHDLLRLSFSMAKGRRDAQEPPAESAGGSKGALLTAG